MRVNTQPLNVNTLKTSNINKSADKSSGKIAVTTSRIQNNAEQCPVVSKKTPIITSEKTVHNQDIKKLRNEISKNLSTIAKKIKSIGTSDGRGCKVILSKNTMTTLNNQLSKLKDNIQSYKKDLERSTYQHNSNKEKTLNKLEGKINNTTAIFHQGNAKNDYLSGDYSRDKTSRTSADKLQRQKDYKAGNGYY
ncbi:MULTISPECIES: hypothetical protein [Providencia]|uniref:hypothetical protein n=1 Tax=Providencia TaxID=586 RepID=UPI000D7EADB4|nr:MULTISPECIES: hypothetical protein [Providencia]AWS51035.1 hypothetical protein AM461_09535 [Providencia rettgeri]MCG5293405.1 hypothetical protein [Providencia rettgeri]WOB80745.1 hypothetical protein P3L37_13605 [Providencia sp. PROV114]HEE8950908.1 hypothetical protein [Providencia rettgeri]HEM6856330.1 hypothetical protein [Providencia rettgeri]